MFGFGLADRDREGHGRKDVEESGLAVGGFVLAVLFFEGAGETLVLEKSLKCPFFATGLAGGSAGLEHLAAVSARGGGWGQQLEQFLVRGGAGVHADFY